VPASKRYYLLYARQLMRNFRTILILFSLGYIGIGGYEWFMRHDVAQTVQWLTAATFPVILTAVIYLYSRQTFIEFTDEGVRVRQFPRRALIPYTDIEKGRIESMERIFDRPERKRLQTGTVRGLYKERALCLRIRSDEGQHEALRRQLGVRTVIEREAVLPVTEVEAAMATLKQRLGARRQTSAEASEGAARRRRHRRGR
jgi:hypothetical protein